MFRSDFKGYFQKPLLEVKSIQYILTLLSLIFTSFYSGEVDEDAYDMRKALKMDAEKKSVIPLKRPIHIDELEY